MAESRIIDYDGTFVTFWYQRHEDDLIIIEKLHAFEFISRIIIHIPEPNFKQIRYYGAYHNSTIILIDIVKFLSKEKSNLFKSLTNNWRSLSLLSFAIDPIVCSLCNIPMLYYYSSFT